MLRQLSNGLRQRRPSHPFEIGQPERGELRRREREQSRTVFGFLTNTVPLLLPDVHSSNSSKFSRSTTEEASFQKVAFHIYFELCDPFSPCVKSHYVAKRDLC